MAHRAIAILISVILLSGFSSPASPGAQRQIARPRLVVVVAVDQFRADYLTRFGDQFTGGLRRMLDEGAVYATAMRRLGNHAEAQEVCQEVLVRAMQKISQLRQPEAFGSWLQSVTNRMAINRAVRKRGAIATEPETMAATCVERDTPLTLSLARERQSQVRAGLRRLGSLDRETLDDLLPVLRA